MGLCTPDSGTMYWAVSYMLLSIADGLCRGLHVIKNVLWASFLLRPRNSRVILELPLSVTALGSGMNPFASGAHSFPWAPARAAAVGLPAFHSIAEWGSALLRTAAVGDSSSLPWSLPRFTEERAGTEWGWGIRPGPNEEGEMTLGGEDQGKDRDLGEEVG